MTLYSFGITTAKVAIKKQNDQLLGHRAIQISELHVALGEVIEAGSVLSVLLNPEE